MRRADPAAPPALTRRELEVAALVQEGMTSRQIARALSLSVRTVEAHLHSAYAKTGTGTRVRLANWLAARAAAVDAADARPAGP